MLRFLHTGDLHLCSSFSAFSPRAATERRERQFAALEKMLTDAVRHGAQLLLFAGDCFDTTHPDPGSVQRFFALLGAQSVPSVVIPGNHDYYVKGSFWDAVSVPAHVHLIKDAALQAVDLPELGATVWGYAFTGETMPTPELGLAADREKGRTHILLAHADLGAAISRYAPISAGQLERTGFSYAALGHIHKPARPRQCGRTVAAYCGFFAGRGFDEVGPGHAYFVEIEEKKVSLADFPVMADRFEEQKVDCTGAAHAEDIRVAVAHFLEKAALPAETALRIHLCGETEPGCRADMASIAALGAHLAIFEIEDETLPIYHAAYLEKDPGLRGAFYRAMLPRLQSESEQERATAAEALRLGFAALAGREVNT